MADSDEFGEFDDSAFLDAATQFEKENTLAFHPSPRPSKRRRIDQQDERTMKSVPPRKYLPNRRPGPFIEEDEEDEADEDESADSDGRKKQPKSKGKENDEDEQEDESPQKRWGNKKKDRIHTPTTIVDLTDMYATQPLRENSPPWKPRGAIWQKPSMITGGHRSSGPQSPKQTRLDAMKTMALPGPQPILSRLTYDIAQELADLPSDAFASSSSSPQKQDEVVLVSERRTRLAAPQTGLRQTTLFGRDGVDEEVPPSQANKRYNFVTTQKEEPPTHHKLNHEAMKTWVYPTNLGTTRDYQFNIVARGLYHNLLVALPTGLGKTFIAATIMLNWYRWTTEAQIVFVAPTKPLCTQQVQACFNITGIPRSQTTLLTGGVAPGLRAEEWASKRVFFMTPQTLLNDLKAGCADPKKIVLLVVDEAHRATGSYAYVEVVSLMRRFNPSFRILALTATPGADVESVQKVIDGLEISKIEIRTENSLDIRNFVHQRKVEKHTFVNSEEMEMCMTLYSQALQPLTNKVAGLNAFWSRDPLDLTPYGCTQSRQKWFASVGKHAPMPQKAMVNTIFQVLGKISQAMELLKYHGIGPFYTKLKDFKQENEGSKSKYKKEVTDSDSFKKLMVRLQSWVISDNFVGHPKLEYLQEAILDHFVNAAEGRNPDGAPPSQTRIMVFAHFRDSAEEIVKILKRHQPMIRPRVFVGQAMAKNSDGMNQKDQLEVIEKFKSGTYNTLVATSIGEEGLDIGEVDLIICYDSKASPIRMLQRMGRTGRKREGKIILLQMKGKEENDAMKAKDAYEKMQELIADGSKFNFHDAVSRRIVPREVQPIVDKCVVEIPLENSQADFLPEPKRRNGRQPKRPPKKFHMPDGVITSFVTAGRMDQEVAPKPRGKKKATPVYPSEELVVCPLLETVLLDNGALRDLERRYQTVYDDDNNAPMIDDLNLGKHVARQRVVSRTGIFSQPGRVAQRFAKTMQRMHEMDDERLGEFRSNVHRSNLGSAPENNMVVSDHSNSELMEGLDPEIWEDDDPASQPQSKPRTRPGPKQKAKTTPKTAAPRSRPPKKAPAATNSPVRQPTVKAKTKTPTYRLSGFADEGEESSPPPTDPQMRLASQAVSLGSDDTVVDDAIEDTQAYLLDSDLRSFIASDNEDIHVPNSSLPSLDFGGLGKGTQAVVNEAKPKRQKRLVKIFTSDPTDDDAVVSSDSDDNMLIQKEASGRATKRPAFVVDSVTESEGDEEAVRLQKRARRPVVDDSEDEE
ncbi:P-loop containing nucleoside triphosphate hydrolase protein [Lindgomyces ingoldianus]|uniref:P-loop containing nucleoside triphosphate hydrolase protein n=1 Tax=Lindgomyces ingoldianus TaxID=673940 RepID=A0ACB6QPQ9_9PLEO|nr:P-loop containing nucleoside triphosphate hydrolase protein [Lindgomyces ingoldianus]KAF2468267.1 P-loop containing nucleoside triphosphate hydrolase protein [Lindgomyces ingoldianus]